MKGMIVFSFALRDKEPNPCNVRLAKAAKRILDKSGEPVMIVARRATALALQKIGVPAVHVIQKRPGYEGSEGMVQQAALVFWIKGVKEVIPVAQPFLQLTKCIQLVRRGGFKTPSFWELCRLIGWIGFDPESKQPWTRGPARLAFYAIRQIFLGYKPPPELSE